MHQDDSKDIRNEALTQLLITPLNIKNVCLMTQDEDPRVRLTAYERLEKQAEQLIGAELRLTDNTKLALIVNGLQDDDQGVAEQCRRFLTEWLLRNYEPQG